MLSDTETLRNAALAYAAAGLKVFPVMPGRKLPATEHGVLDATTDARQIEAWWASIPYLIGMATGPESGIFVIDVDPRNGGAWDCPVQTFAVRSGGRYEGVAPGTHYWFKWPAGIAKMKRDLIPGVDVQGVGKYVIVPPSVTDAMYEVIDPSPAADAPLELLAQIAIIEGATTDTRPGDRFNATHTVREIIEPHGWTIDHIGHDGEEYWTRPGKDEGVSATYNYQGNGLFYVFSTSTGFDPEVGYDAFGVWARLEHDGDFNAAASALAELEGHTQPVIPQQGEGMVGSSVVTGSASVAAPTVAPAAPVPAASSPSSLWVPGPAYELPLPDAHLVKQYVTYGDLVSDASPEYQEAAALSLLAVMCGGMRISMAHVPQGMGVNLYLALVGPSSLSRKSSVQQLMQSFLLAIRPNALLPDRMTGEAAIAELGQRSHVPAVWTPDEIGLTITEIYQRGGFLQALETLLLTLYSGQEYKYQTIGGGQTSITGIDLNVFGASTPEGFSGAGHRALSTGLLPRFGIVYPAHRPPSRPPITRTEAHNEWQRTLTARFRQVFEMCVQPMGQRTVYLQPDAFAVLGSLDEELGKQALTSRLVMAAYKVTALIALADLRFEAYAADAQAAAVIVRRWAEGALRLRRFLSRSMSDVALMEQIAAARLDIATIPGTLGVDGRVGISQTIIATKLALPALTIKRIRDTMELTGEVIVARDEGSGEEVWRVRG